MKIFALFLLLLTCLSVTSIDAQNAQAPQLGKASVKQIVAAMTLEEKASLVVGKGGMVMPAIFGCRNSRCLFPWNCANRTDDRTDAGSCGRGCWKDL